MKYIRTFAMLLAMALIVITAKAQVTTTPTGATFTLDSITTEAIVYAPNAVRIIKYKVEKPAVKHLKIKGLPKLPAAGERAVQDGHNKVMVDAGDFFVAINTKDGNVSFWSHDDKLILAEQHKTGLFLTDSVSGKPFVSQDFQLGRAKVETLLCPEAKEAARVNLMGRSIKVGDKKGALPKGHLKADKGFEIFWLSDGETTLDALPREGKKNGDISLRSSDYIIDYLFEN